MAAEGKRAIEGLAGLMGGDINPGSSGDRER